MYERILVPLDGSKPGEAALPYVAELVSKMGPEVKIAVTLLQVISSVAYSVVAGEAVAPVPYTEIEIEQSKKRAKEYLERVSESLRSKKAMVTTRVEVGNAVDEILKVTEEIKADLVAMSTRGRSGFSRWAFGSVTDKVLRAGSAPVLVVRASEKTTKA